MIDAKSILDQLVRGAGGSGQSSQNSPASGRGDDLASLLRHLLGGGDDPHGHSPSEQGRDPSEPQGRVSPNAPDRGVSFEDVRRSRPSRDQSLPEGPTEPESQGSGQGGGLADILGQFLGQGRSQPGAPGGGNLAEILGQVLGQATGDVKQGAQRLDAATGASSNLKDMLGQLSGRPPEQVIEQIKELIAQNKLGAGAALGGLGALILGSRSGRSIATTAAKLGAIALIGSLAHRAYQTYTQGQGPSASRNMLMAPAPEGSGFEEGAVTNDAAMTYVRAMIAAAAADGRFDEREQERILGSLRGSGLGDKAEAFLAAEVANPASVDDLAALVSTPEEAMQVYTAARLVIEPGTEAENEFLQALAGRLGIDPTLASHIDSVTTETASGGARHS